MMHPADTIKIFQSALEFKTYPAGTVIFQSGEPGECMYGILAGEVEQLIDGEVRELLTAGDVFGVGALVHEDGLRISTAIAKTDCKLACIDRRHFLFAVQETPLFALEVLRSYSDRLRNLKTLPLPVVQRPKHA